MHCASCAGIIEKTFKKTDGVLSVSVNYGNESAKISFDDSKTSVQSLSEKIKPLGYSFLLEEKNNKKENSELKDMKLKIMSALPIAFISVLFMAWEILSKYGFFPAHGRIIG